MAEGPTLLTGAAGLLGHWLLQSAPQLRDVVALNRRRAAAGVASVTADLREPAGVAAAVARVDPTLVIHAAYAKDCESIVDATQHVVDAANATGASVVFISTDAVFLGDGVARDERSAPDATWDYGRWKATAERIVLDGSEHSAIVRLPLLVSIKPDDHVVREIRAGAARGMPTRWFTDEMRRPTFASDVAAVVWRIAALPAGERRGRWHLAGAERPPVESSIACTSPARPSRLRLSPTIATGRATSHSPMAARAPRSAGVLPSLPEPTTPAPEVAVVMSTSHGIAPAGRHFHAIARRSRTRRFEIISVVLGHRAGTFCSAVRGPSRLSPCDSRL